LSRSNLPEIFDFKPLRYEKHGFCPIVNEICPFPLFTNNEQLIDQNIAWISINDV